MFDQEGAMQQHFSETKTQAKPGRVTAPTETWFRAFADLPREHGFEPLDVEGRLPDDLRGTLYRTGPSLFSSFGRPYQHWFDGDGAVSAVRFGGGIATGAVRVVQSAGLLAERQAGRALFGAYGTSTPGSIFQRLRRLNGKNAANISVAVWQGRVFALFEAGKPTELDPHDLRTLGESDLDGAVLQTFSAHPHWIPERHAAYNFGVRYGRKPMLDLYELPADGQARRMASLPLPGSTMIHDFIATPRHLIFFAPPLRLNLAAMLLGRRSFSENLRWRPELGTHVMVVPIDDPTNPIRFDAEGFYQWHFANAYEEDTRLVVDLVRYPDFGTNQWLGQIAQGDPGGPAQGRLERVVLDVEGRKLETSRLWNRSVEFPRLSSSVIGRQHRFVYLAAHSSVEASARGLFDQVARYDAATGTGQAVSLGREQYPSEPVFVPRPAHAGEDDGWLLTLVYDAVSHTSHIAVLDAARIEDGPVARARFDHHLPFTFHGNFDQARA
jgi:all-trans-8'-apo-beta-carotenal 15,15'-oxygenase